MSKNENPDIFGNWHGVIDIGGAKLPIDFIISKNSDGSLSAILINIFQGRKIPADSFSYKNGNIQINLDSVKAKFEGKYQSSTNNIVGKWSQSGQNFEVTLKQVETFPNLSRPQEPHPPYPYIEENITFANSKANIILAGTLTYPKENPPFPAVLLITGSGAHDRNETIFGHKPFFVIGDYLTRKGIVVLRVDDRGVGGSAGNYAESTNDDFSEDARAGIDYLKTRKEIDPNKIGLIGHSEGGVIAPILASKYDDIAFIILMAGPGLELEQILYKQADLISRAENVPEPVINIQHKLQKQMFSIVKEEKNLEKAKEKITQAINDMEKEFETLNIPLSNQASIDAQIAMVLSPWFRNFLNYDPTIALKKVKCPVLALNGEKDLQVPAKENLDAIHKALKEGGNNDHKILELSSINHLFQNCKTGGLSEYAQIPETISPTVLKIIGDWILEHIN